jgi:hypothetical protein
MSLIWFDSMDCRIFPILTMLGRFFRVPWIESLSMLGFRLERRRSPFEEVCKSWVVGIIIEDLSSSRRLAL